MMSSNGTLVDTVLGATVTTVLFAMSVSAIGATAAVAERIVHRSHALATVSRFEVTVEEWCARVGRPDPQHDLSVVKAANSIRLGHLDGVRERELIVVWGEDGIEIGHAGETELFSRLRVVTAQTISEPFPALRIVVTDGLASWPIVAPLAGATIDGPSPNHRATP